MRNKNGERDFFSFNTLGFLKNAVVCRGKYYLEILEVFIS
jgi:hypothetical protein